MGGVASDTTSIDYRLKVALPIATAVIYFFSNSTPQNYYDYTFRVAEKMLRGGVGFAERQPSWLNEFVPYEGAWYSVFPLGAVLSMRIRNAACDEIFFAASVFGVRFM